MANGSDHETRLSKLEKDLYHGNGKAALTIRVEKNEDALVYLKHDVKNLEEDQKMECAEINKRVDGVDKKFAAIIILLITVLAGLITSMVMEVRTQPQQQHSTMSQFE